MLYGTIFGDIAGSTYEYRPVDKSYKFETVTERSHFTDDTVMTLAVAKWLLENTIIPVTQIAEQCGYLNSSHFIRQFGSRVEMTPSDYRKKFSKEQ